MHLFHGRSGVLRLTCSDCIFQRFELLGWKLMINSEVPRIERITIFFDGCYGRLKSRGILVDITRFPICRRYRAAVSLGWQKYLIRRCYAAAHDVIAIASWAPKIGAHVHHGMLYFFWRNVTYIWLSWKLHYYSEEFFHFSSMNPVSSPMQTGVSSFIPVGPGICPSVPNDRTNDSNYPCHSVFRVAFDVPSLVYTMIIKTIHLDSGSVALRSGNCCCIIAQTTFLLSLNFVSDVILLPFSGWSNPVPYADAEYKATITRPPFDDSLNPFASRSLCPLGLGPILVSCQMYSDVFRDPFESEIWSSWSIIKRWYPVLTECSTSFATMTANFKDRTS